MIRPIVKPDLAMPLFCWTPESSMRLSGNLDAVAKQDPTNGMAWYLQSQAFLRKGSYGQAVDAGEQAVKLTPANAEAHLWLGEALRRNSQCDWPRLSTTSTYP